MTSALGGGEGGSPKADDSTDKLRECDSDKGEGGGGQKIRKLCGRHLGTVPLIHCFKAIKVFGLWYDHKFDMQFVCNCNK